MASKWTGAAAVLLGLATGGPATGDNFGDLVRPLEAPVQLAHQDGWRDLDVTVTYSLESIGPGATAAFDWLRWEGTVNRRDVEGGRVYRTEIRSLTTEYGSAKPLARPLVVIEEWFDRLGTLVSRRVDREGLGLTRLKMPAQIDLAALIYRPVPPAPPRLAMDQRIAGEAFGGDLAYAGPFNRDALPWRVSGRTEADGQDFVVAGFWGEQARRENGVAVAEAANGHLLIGTGPRLAGRLHLSMEVTRGEAAEARTLQARISESYRAR